MAFLETLLLTVGPAIGKGVLARWLGESEVAGEVGGSLVDLLAARTGDRVAQRRGARQFEEIGERVAESLLPLFEGALLEEGSREAVALQVAETLNGTPLDAQWLAERNLEPSEVARCLLEARPEATRDFSGAEKALYERVIRESASAMVDIASQLPNFSERTFGEVLRRQGEMLDVVERVLEEVRKIREQSQRANPEQAAAIFEQRYREAIVRQLDEIALFGVDLPRASRRHPLSVAYVTLSVTQTVSSSSHPTFFSGVLADFGDFGEPRERRVTLAVDEALAGSRRWLILGAAGSGKTTLLKWMAVRSALGDFGEQLNSWNGQIPFFVRLRQFSQGEWPAPEDFPRLVAPAIAGEMPAGWVHQQLRAGRALLLVDGVDEVEQGRREEVLRWLEELIGAYPDNLFIVSSRPYAAKEQWLAHEGFENGTLQAMDLPNIDAFIERWHEAVRQQLRNQQEIADLAPLASHLKAVIRQQRPLRHLATNPLLCAMLCALNRNRRQQLPSDRIQLYEACIQMLLERRDIERRVALKAYPRLSYRQMRTLLDDFAYWMLDNGYSQSTSQDADQQFERKLAHMLRLEGVEACDVRRFFVERSGILQEPISGQLNFTHRTFQEFLAAQAALDKGNLGALVRNAYDDQWHQVIILAAGLANKRERETLIRRLTKLGDQNSKRRATLHLLAVACLETATELDPTLQQQVQTRLTKLVPPQNMEEAEALAAAGELAVPFLAFDREMEDEVAAACVRALSLIGGEGALSTLVSYSRNQIKQYEFEDQLFLELVRGWDSFETEAYFKQVLWKVRDVYLTAQSMSFLEKLQSLSPLDPSADRPPPIALKALAQLPYLSRLTLRDLPALNELTPLAHLPNLSGLALRELPALNDFTPLAQLPNLSRLYLLDLPALNDLTPLAQSPNLSRLDLIGLPALNDLTPLLQLPNLSRLYLSNLPALDSFTPLAQLPNLSRLYLHDLRALNDLTPLAHLPNLSRLYLRDLPALNDFTPLAQLPNLSWLTLSNLPALNDLTPLAHLPNLSRLDLRDLPALNDLTGVAQLPNLSRLDLWSLPALNNLKPLLGLTRLRKLVLSDMPQELKIPAKLAERVQITRL
ncbi:MAG: NACHT domain-containing protein [Ardenticatenaceae bacterium]